MLRRRPRLAAATGARGLAWHGCPLLEREIAELREQTSAAEHRAGAEEAKVEKEVTELRAAAAVREEELRKAISDAEGAEAEARTRSAALLAQAFKAKVQSIKAVVKSYRAVDLTSIKGVKQLDSRVHNHAKKHHWRIVAIEAMQEIRM